VEVEKNIKNVVEKNSNGDFNMQRQYIFTKNGFYPENTGEETEDEEVAEFLYDIGNIESPSKLTVSGYFLYLVSDAFFKELTRLPELEIARDKIKVAPTQECIERLLNATPYAIGTEFIDEKWIRNRFSELETIFQGQIRNYKGSVAMYLAERNQSLHVPERIFLHLVESKNDDAPFAFIATYASRQSDGSVQHMPLQYALTEYRDDREKLLTLLSSLNRAVEVSPLIAELMESGEMFHTLKFTVDDAYSFLKDIEKIEETGILCRIPNWWRKKNSMLSVNVKLGEEKPSMVGFDALVSLQPSLEVDGVRLTQSEIEQLLRQTEGLAFLKGKWIEVNHEKLRKLLEEMEDIPESLSFRDAVQLEMGNDKILPDVGIVVSNEAWMSRMLLNLREPNRIRSVAVPKTLKATLRPYQKSGYSWLNYMNRLGFGACLADDMGLGKTIQVLTYLEKLRKTDKEAKEELPFLTITTYAMAAKIEPLKEKEWDCLIFDEAQAIKNPTTKQTREIKKMKSKMRIAMTGTPIENDLTNLWSLFDFLNHGLLGASKEFHEFCKGLEEHPEKYAKLKSMISPFMLRRVKTDKNIISDLPEKVEMLDYATLSRKQTVLYRKAVSDMEKRVLEAEGIERRGIYEKRERVIVFTQFKEITEYLAEYLTGIFHAKGYVIHGGTPVKRRTEIVEKFQGERYVPFIVLSVKAAGTGLNLTKANHVIHFDRWWNPAVENQATDRAFRIGQTKDVMVHKFVSKGTIEEKIDAIINSKKELAENVIGSGGEKWITDLNNEELFSLLRLEE
jgi:SNF2 family DNA or RNA helicase